MDFLHMQIQSQAARTPLPVDVLVPNGEHKGPFKSVYLLHDLAGNNSSWMRKFPLESYIDDAVIIMPSCLNSFYVNMYYGYDMLDYITKELIEICEGWFELDDRRLVAGIGMGGYGAVRAALAAPKVFKQAICIDGLLDPGKFYDEPLPALKMEDVFGPKEYFYYSDNCLKNAVHGKNLLFTCPPPITLIGEGAQEWQEILKADVVETGDPMTVLAQKVRGL